MWWSKFKDNISYKIDNIMSGGTVSLVGVLLLLTVAVVVAAG